MLAKRIIPCLDVRRGRVVKGTKFKKMNDVNDPVELARYYNSQGADELVFYDITASSEERNIIVDVVERTAKEVFIPLTVGGGIRTLKDFWEILRAGADKISINSSAVKNPRIIKEGSMEFGSQCVVLSIDTKKIGEDWFVFINGGRTNTGLDAIEWAKRGVDLGAGELVINSIDEDGMKNGYDIELIRKISQEVNVPLIASGGAGKKADFYKAFKEGGADGALAASVFHFKEIKIEDLKEYLDENGISVRRRGDYGEYI